jgi:ABC-type glycerol-3-phosphate transport system substrate-binding protein
MHRKVIWAAVVLLLAAGIAFGGGQEEKAGVVASSPGGIEWNKPISMVERISGDRYILPQGWKEAMAGITEISFYNSGGLQTDIATYMNMKRFEELTGIKVNAIPLAGELMYSKALSIMVSGDGSVALIGVGGPDTDLMPYVAGNWLVTLDSLFPPEVENLYSPGFKTFYSVANHWYAAPIATLGVGGFFYRPSWLKKAGVEVPTSWEELLVAAQKMREWAKVNVGPDVYGAVFPGLNVNYQYLLQNLTASQGARWYQDRKWKFDSPQFRNAFAMLVELVKTGAASQDCLNMALWDAGRLFGVGKAAFTFGLVSSYAWQYSEQFPDVKGDFVFGPPLRWSVNDPESFQAGVLTANSLAITKAATASQQAAGMLFIDFIRSKEAQRNEAVVELNETFMKAVYAEQDPGKKVDWEFTARCAKELGIAVPAKRDELLFGQTRKTITQYAQTNVFPPGYWEILNKIVEMFGKAALGTITVDEALANVQKFASTF